LIDRKELVAATDNDLPLHRMSSKAIVNQKQNRGQMFEGSTPK